MQVDECALFALLKCKEYLRFDALVYENCFLKAYKQCISAGASGDGQESD